MNPNAKLVLIGLGVGVVVLGAVYFAGKKLLDAGAKAANAVNPLNHDNVFATSVNDVGASVTGDKDFTLGGAIYDLFHSDPLSNTEKK